MATGKIFTLNNGKTIPAVGLGTWQSKPEEVYDAVQVALKCGYRHIDTAWAYDNEPMVGKAIVDSGIPRSEIFLTTKLWSTFHSRPEEALEKSLKSLQTDYLDAWLMHWPIALNPNGNDYKFPKRPDGSRDIQEGWDFLKTWAEMEKLYKSTDKLKSIGVSNFSTVTLDKLLAQAKVVPAINQVELHPYLPQEKLYEYCTKKGIHLTAYSPLGSTNSPLHTEKVIQDIAKKYNKSVPQILISWGEVRWSVVPKSVTASRIEQNFDDVELKKEDVATIDAISRENGSKRLIAPNWGVTIFHDD